MKQNEFQELMARFGLRAGGDLALGAWKGWPVKVKREQVYGICNIQAEFALSGRVDKEHAKAIAREVKAYKNCSAILGLSAVVVVPDKPKLGSFTERFTAVMDLVVQGLAEAGVKPPVVCPLCKGGGCDSMALLNDSYVPTHRTCVTSSVQGTLEKAEKELYNERQTIGRIADQKEKFAKEQPYFPEAPEAPLSATELIRQQQELLAKNGENQRLRARLHDQEQEKQRVMEQLQELLKRQETVEEQLRLARMSAEDLQDESTAELEESIAGIEESNRKVRANLDKEKAEEDAREYQRQYQALTEKLEGVRGDKAALLESAELPLPELSVADGELVYRGHKWDNMSGSDQLKVSAAIVRKLNPNCGFVLMDKLEQMDLDTLRGFAAWLEQEGLQAIATRVSTGEECSVIIEDGQAAGQPPAEPKAWKAGTF